MVSADWVGEAVDALMMKRRQLIASVKNYADLVFFLNHIEGFPLSFLIFYHKCYHFSIGSSHIG